MGIQNMRASSRADRGAWGAMLTFLILAVTVSGCGTGGLAVKKDVWEAEEGFEQRQAALSEKVLRLEDRIGVLDEKIGAVEHQVSGLSTQVGALETELSRGIEAVRDGQQQLGIELEGRIRSVDQDRSSDREDLIERMSIILDEVTSENRQLRGEIDALRSSVATGYGHTVKRGETLASIAAQYGVTVAEIAAANSITNPNLISVGQELVIPAR